MLRNISLLVAATAIAGCNGSTSPPPPTSPSPAAAPVTAVDTPAPPTSTTAVPPPAAPPPTRADKNVATINAMNAAISAGDAAKVATFYAPDGVVKQPGDEDHAGRDAIAASMKSEFGAFPDMKLAATRMFANDDVVVEEWTCTGTNTGAGFGPPTGKAFGMNGASVFVLDADGQIKEEHEFADAPTVLAQLGMSKAPARPVIALPAVPPEVHVAKGTSDEARDADIARAISRAIAAYDESAFAAVYSDNVSWDDLTQLAPTSGKSARVDALRSMKAAFRSPKLDCSFWSFDGFVAQECALTAQSTGARLVGTAKLSANHKTVALHELDIIMVKDGKVVSGRGYGNRMELAAQLAPPKPEAKKVVPKDASKQPSR